MTSLHPKSKKLREIKTYAAHQGDGFSQFAKKISYFSGRPLCFFLACISILVWVALGPVFHFSDTWQLVINTGTTIVTFLMVFLIQNTQNRDTQALQLKLDELLRAHKGAHTALLDLEELNEDELEKVKMEYLKIAEKGRKSLKRGLKDTGTPAVKA